MNPRKTILLAFVLISCLTASARQVTDTLYSPQKDRVIVTYDMVQKDGKVEIRFLDAKKKLGAANKDRYKNMSKIVVMFFDRIGSFKDLTLKGLGPSMFMVPSDIEYERSEDGYFIIGQDAALTFNADLSKATKLSIPLFLAEYERKSHYKIFAPCGALDIMIGLPGPQGQNNEGKTNETFVPLEIEDALSDTDAEALASVNYIMEQLSEIEKLPFSEMFINGIAEMNQSIGGMLPGISRSNVSALVHNSI